MTHQHGRRRRLDALLLGLAFVILVTLIGLGVWQLQRLSWKLALINAVETRAYSAPVPLPSVDGNLEESAYLRIAVRGQFRHDLSTRVKAITALGPGHWILTPLETETGNVWVNRGFVRAGVVHSEWTRPDGLVTVEGLLRVTEPSGTLLERNDPAVGRWVSRDVDAMTEFAGLTEAMPYFIDADHASVPEAWPRGGMTVVKFRNPHLSYALTWFTMAALFLVSLIYMVTRRKLD